MSSSTGKQQPETARESLALDTTLAHELGAQELRSAGLFWKKWPVSTEFNRICSNY